MSDSYEEQQRIWERMQEKRKRPNREFLIIPVKKTKKGDLIGRE